MEHRLIGSGIVEAFEEFLSDRLSEGIQHTDFAIRKWDNEKMEYVGPKLDIVSYLEAAGIDQKTADDMGADIIGTAGDAQEKDYGRGFKDGFRLAAHLLGGGSDER